MGVPDNAGEPRRHQKAQRGGLLIRLLGCASPPTERDGEACPLPPMALTSPQLTRSASAALVDGRHDEPRGEQKQSCCIVPAGSCRTPCADHGVDLDLSLLLRSSKPRCSSCGGPPSTPRLPGCKRACRELPLWSHWAAGSKLTTIWSAMQVHAELAAHVGEHEEHLARSQAHQAHAVDLSIVAAVRVAEPWSAAVAWDHPHAFGTRAGAGAAHSACVSLHSCTGRPGPRRSCDSEQSSQSSSTAVTKQYCRCCRGRMCLTSSPTTTLAQLRSTVHFPAKACGGATYWRPRRAR